MENKFENVPVEPDTNILLSIEATPSDYDVLYQQWIWDSIKAESIIFYNDDIEDLEEDEILNEVRTSPLVNEGSGTTIKRSDSGFTFVNFNFEA